MLNSKKDDAVAILIVSAGAGGGCEGGVGREGMAPPGKGELGKTDGPALGNVSLKTT